MPDSAAVIFVFPAAMPVAKPVEEIDATLVFELAQVTFAVISAVESSEKVPVAENRTVSPTAKLSGVDGVIAMEDNAGGATVNFIDGLVIPDTVAVRLTLPWVWAVAKPDEEMEAILVSELVKEAFAVTSAVDLSAKVPTTLNCWVSPTASPAGAAGVIAMEDKADAGTTFNGTAVLVFPARAAVILTLPGATPVAKPAAEIVAIVLSELVQVA
jgi:hypothetical protein